MKDISDYLWRMFMAIFLCPVAAFFWLAFVFLLVSFVVTPPRFSYSLDKRGGRAAVSVA